MKSEAETILEVFSACENWSRVDEEGLTSLVLSLCDLSGVSLQLSQAKIVQWGWKGVRC